MPSSAPSAAGSAMAYRPENTPAIDGSLPAPSPSDLIYWKETRSTRARQTSSCIADQKGKTTVSDPRRLVDKLWAYCNVLRDDGVGVIEYTEQTHLPAVPEDGTRAGD